MAFAIKAGTLIDGNGGEPLWNAVVLVEGKRIVAVVPAEGIELLLMGRKKHANRSCCRRAVCQVPSRYHLR